MDPTIIILPFWFITGTIASLKCTVPKKFCVKRVLLCRTFPWPPHCQKHPPSRLFRHCSPRRQHQSSYRRDFERTCQYSSCWIRLAQVSRWLLMDILRRAMIEIFWPIKGSCRPYKCAIWSLPWRVLRQFRSRSPCLSRWQSLFWACSPFGCNYDTADWAFISSAFYDKMIPNHQIGTGPLENKNAARLRNLFHGAYRIKGFPLKTGPSTT